MAFLFGLEDVKVAAWNSAENWGSAYDLNGAHMMQVELQTVNGILEGDDEIKDAHAKVISGSMQVRFAFDDLNVLGVITGQTVTDSASVNAITFDTTDLPYFGICGKLSNTGDAGCSMLFAPKVKIMEGFRVGGQYGQYTTPELTATMIRDSAVYGVYKIFQYTADQTVTIPPPVPA